MKKIAFLILLFIIIHNAEAKKRHEFGIGIGYNECIIHPKINFNEDYTNSDKRVILYQIVGSPFQDGYSSFSNQYYQSSFTLPCLYYQYQLAKHLELRLSFQMSSAKSISRIPSYMQFPSEIIERKMRKYDLNLGYYFTLLQSEKARLSLGLGLNLNPLIEKEQNFSAGSVIDNSKYIESQLRGYSALSICIPLDQCINFKYDIACLTDAVTVYLRPTNRVSINFRF